MEPIKCYYCQRDIKATDEAQEVEETHGLHWAHTECHTVFTRPTTIEVDELRFLELQLQSLNSELENLAHRMNRGQERLAELQNQAEAIREIRRRKEAMQIPTKG